MKLSLTIISLLLFQVVSKAQIYKESQVQLQAMDSSEQMIETRTDGALVFLNTASGDLSVKLNLHELKTGNNTVDSIMNAYTTVELVFSGNTQMDIFRMFETQNDGRSYTINGTVSILGKSWSSKAIFDPINFNGAFDPGEIKMEFRLFLDPRANYIPGFSDAGFKAVNFEISPGLVNISNP